MRPYLLTLLLFLLPVSAQAMPANSDECTPQIGKPVCSNRYWDINGNPVLLSDYKGKIVVLEWTNPQCPFVHKYYDSGQMQTLQAYAHDKGVVWITINSSAPGKAGSLDKSQAKAYLNEYKAVPTHYVLDSDGEFGKSFDAKSTPDMFVIDTNGNLAYMGAIDNKPTPKMSSLEGAHNYVRAAIDSLLAGKPIKTASTQSYGCGVKYGD